MSSTLRSRKNVVKVPVWASGVGHLLDLSRQGSAVRTSAVSDRFHPVSGVSIRWRQVHLVACQWHMMHKPWLFVTEALWK